MTQSHLSKGVCMKTLAWVIVMLASLAATADSAGKIMDLKGSAIVERNGQKLLLKLGDGVEYRDRIRGDSGTFIRLELPSQKMVLRGKFNVVLNTPATQSSFSILGIDEGQVRIKTTASSKGPQAVAKTPAAVAGVRGTDLWVSYEPTLKESEVICFEHAITFVPKSGKGEVLVHAGQWGGLGGRFGKTIQPPISLPSAVLDSKKKELEL